MLVRHCIVIALSLLINYPFGSEGTDNNNNIKPEDVTKIADLLVAMNQKLDSLNKMLSEKIEQTINFKFNEFSNNINEELVKLKEKLICKQEDVYNREDDKPTTAEKTPEEIKLTALCKETTVSSLMDKTFSIDGYPFGNVFLRRAYTGRLAYFEMHIVIHAGSRVAIQLSDKRNISNSDIRFYIDIGRNNNQYTELQYKSRVLRRIYTPDILSSIKAKAFYVKIDNGKLEFGKRGSYGPLLSYYDTRFESVNYLTFGTWEEKAKFYYDCPAPVHEFPCKDVTLSDSDQKTLTNSIQNSKLNHFTVQRNSTGHLTYFETHIKIQSDDYVYIQLMDKETYSKSDNIYQIYVGYDKNSNTQLYTWADGWKQLTPTPNILSPIQPTAFYIEIDDGKLEFGKEGGTPLISYEDSRVSLVNYFQFYYSGGGEAKISYDCPALIEGSL